MKIVYLHQYYKTNKQAGGTRSYEFCKHLVQEGNHVVLITGEKISESNAQSKFDLYSTDTKYSNKMSFLRRIFAFMHYNIKTVMIGMREKDVNVIFATSTPLTIGLPGVILSKLKRCKLIFEVRDVWPDIPIELGFIRNKFMIYLLKKFEMWIYKNSNQIIVLSDGMYNNLLNKGVPSSKLHVITNLSNTYLYNSVQVDGFPIKELSDKFVCIHPGAMGFVNGLDYVLDAAKELRDKDKDIVFLLVGEGKLKEHLLSRIENENLYNVIIKNSMPKEEVVKLIKSADIGIMCVKNYKILEDNSANKFFDFLAAGLPIIINYGGWQKETILNANCGYACDPDIALEMAEKILEIKNNNELYMTMKVNSKNTADKLYSTDRCLAKLNEVFESL